MANKPALFAVDDLDVLWAVEREYAEGLPRTRSTCSRRVPTTGPASRGR
jgi:hypothetical protein